MALCECKNSTRYYCFVHHAHVCLDCVSSHPRVRIPPTPHPPTHPTPPPHTPHRPTDPTPVCGRPVHRLAQQPRLHMASPVSDLLLHPSQRPVCHHPPPVLPPGPHCVPGSLSGCPPALHCPCRVCLSCSLLRSSCRAPPRRLLLHRTYSSLALCPHPMVRTDQASPLDCSARSQ